MKRYLALIVLAVSTLGVAHAQTVLSPNVPSGNTEVFAPLQVVGRVQQVYSASDFTPLDHGGLLTQIALRYEPQVPFSSGAIASNVLITMSTTQKSPDALSPFFAENVGPDETVVYGTAPIAMPPGDRPGFDVFITLTTPFLYNPSVGNLLV